MWCDIWLRLVFIFVFYRNSRGWYFFMLIVATPWNKLMVIFLKVDDIPVDDQLFASLSQRWWRRAWTAVRRDIGRWKSKLISILIRILSCFFLRLDGSNSWNGRGCVYATDASWWRMLILLLADRQKTILVDCFIRSNWAISRCDCWWLILVERSFYLNLFL